MSAISAASQGFNLPDHASGTAKRIATAKPMAESNGSSQRRRPRFSLRVQRTAPRGFGGHSGPVDLETIQAR